MVEAPGHENLCGRTAGEGRSWDVSSLTLSCCRETQRTGWSWTPPGAFPTALTAAERPTQGGGASPGQESPPARCDQACALTQAVRDGCGAGPHGHGFWNPRTHKPVSS